VDDNIISMMVEQTNIYANQTLNNTQRRAKIKWVETSPEEMRNFLGLICYMGLIPYPTLRSYWSQDPLYKNNIVPSIMSRNRFEIILRMWHFANNEDCPANDRLFKISTLVEKLIENYKKMLTPGETVCVDESLVPYRGRLSFKQYIPNKASKYGVKVFKLCCDNGYTHNLKIYAGRERDPSGAVPTNVVMTLAEDLLDSGRTIVADNYYCSLELANKLLDRKTHLLGTLRSNRKGNPKEVTTKKLKCGEVAALENSRGIVVLKWHDKRDVLMISTKHNSDVVEVSNKFGKKVNKPAMVLEYNKWKAAIDTSDQMSSYSTSLRRTVKWYHKIAIECLFGTTLVNALILFNKTQTTRMSITKFKEELVKSLLKKSVVEEPALPIATKRRSLNSHRFDKKVGKFDKVRKYCKGCYAKHSEGKITKNKVKKVVSYCKDCENEPHYCLDCFHIFHKNV
jgi:hypothetical protein